MTSRDAPGTDFLDRVEKILLEAKAAPAEKRDDLIRARCGDDKRLRAEVEAMLRAEANVADQFLQQSVASALGTSPDSAMHPPAGARTVGPWTVEEPLGAGGMGAVFRGRRSDGAFEQEVAVKFIHGGLLDPAMRDRFVQERQILATLDHPNIARLLDGGVTEAGQPYLVMELVSGESLLEYCDGRRMTIDGRLAIFDRLCEAVQHAHGNLVVHRDIKPSNILVDESGRPRLVDFGIASVIEEGGAAGTMTADRRFTPQYAAPEQVRGEPVTVATDVYALGIVLYELLAGARPYEVTGRHTPTDTLAICEIDPPRPSRRLDSAGEDPATDLTAIADARETEPNRLRRTLRGDLDDIVMTALRKEPSRRYATVEALREDLRRYRRGLPVAARPDTWAYRTRRFISRHRVPVGAAVALAVVLIAAATVSTGLALRLNEQAIALGAALSDRERALDEARAQREEAQRQSRRALSSSSALVQTLTHVAADDESARHQIVEQLHDKVERLDTASLPLIPDVEVATRQAIAMLARTIEAFDLALEQNARVLALTEDRPQDASVRAQTYAQIGWIHLLQGKPDEAVAAFLAGRAIDQRDRQPRHLTAADVHLMEAYLMLDEVDAARAVLAERPLPPPPLDVFMRERVSTLESRFGVSLPTPAPAE